MDISSLLFFSPMKAMQRNAPQFSHYNKGFIIYIFCRNWVVRNPAGTRLDSSLVNKQVGYRLDIELCMTKITHVYAI